MRLRQKPFLVGVATLACAGALVGTTLPADAAMELHESADSSTSSVFTHGYVSSAGGPVGGMGALPPSGQACPADSGRLGLHIGDAIPANWNCSISAEGIQDVIGDTPSFIDGNAHSLGKSWGGLVLGTAQIEDGHVLVFLSGTLTSDPADTGIETLIRDHDGQHLTVTRNYLGSLSSPAVTGDDGASPATVTGTAIAGATIHIREAAAKQGGQAAVGETLGTGTADQQGIWSVKLSHNPPSGNVTVSQEVNGSESDPVAYALSQPTPVMTPWWMVGLVAAAAFAFIAGSRRNRARSVTG